VIVPLKSFLLALMMPRTKKATENQQELREGCCFHEKGSRENDKKEKQIFNTKTT
jgi:hypothetical protein